MRFYRHRPRGTRLPALTLLAVGWASAVLAQAPATGPQALQNRFNDPFIQATAGLPGCPVPAGPGVTEDEFREQQHGRTQRGNSCWLAGRCRLQSAYLYDAEIVPRVKQALLADGRFAAGTSIWASGQRRWVWLHGCVSTPEQAAQAEARVRDIDDVEAVINELMVGTTGRPPYRVQGMTAPAPAR